MEDKDYESHVRSNESIRDSMDGVMQEPNKQMSREDEHKTCCGQCNGSCNRDQSMSRG
jgi:hypothetical protein